MDDPRNERIDEVAADLGELRREVRTGFAEVRAEIAGVRAEIADVRTEIATEKQWTRAEFAAVRAEAAEFRSEVRAGFEDMRRYFDVVAEDFRGMNRLLAEGLIAVNERIDRLETRFETRMTEGFAEMRELFRVAFSDHERRLRVLEGHAGL